ncbi:hypothetical protein [Amycolatopsis umgeniensis]|uniref:Uncharacterized protein n=1 Tax=Amycolatopsis umgeniensis TaxID=336628 RepID=A0A841AWM3_9PSEU|nr:hypothetical protein [Amycolatopsis umgeniensis]MBB5850752.1 hypothetical protein [Amycolatopsis umgeniensis]
MSAEATTTAIISQRNLVLVALACRAAILTVSGLDGVLTRMPRLLSHALASATSIAVG